MPRSAAAQARNRLSAPPTPAAVPTAAAPAAPPPLTGTCPGAGGQSASGGRPRGGPGRAEAGAWRVGGLLAAARLTPVWGSAPGPSFRCGEPWQREDEERLSRCRSRPQDVGHKCRVRNGVGTSSESRAAPGRVNVLHHCRRLFQSPQNRITERNRRAFICLNVLVAWCSFLKMCLVCNPFTSGCPLLQVPSSSTCPWASSDSGRATISQTVLSVTNVPSR